MRHKGSNPIIIKGKRVILSEVVPEYFEYIILWRNNKRLNKYINQSFELTIDSQYKWYREKYLVDPTQGFFVMLEKATNRPFATIGWTGIELYNYLKADIGDFATELLYLTRMEMYDSILVIIRRRICCMLSIVRNEDNVN